MFTTFDNALPVRILGLGEVTLAEPLYTAEIEEKLKELIDMYKKLNEEKTTLEECRDLLLVFRKSYRVLQG